MSEVSLFDSLASEYDAWFEDEGKLIFATEVRAFKKVLPLLPEPWLEMGVGSGRFAQALGIATGIDPSAKLLSMATKRGIAGFLASGEEEVFPERTFGTVFIIMTLCFVNSPLAVLKEAHRILKSGGKITLGLVCKDSPWGRFYLRKKERGSRYYKHANFFGYQELIELLGQAGFVVDTIVSTLFQKPDKVEFIEPARKGFFSDAGFTVIVARKVHRSSHQ